MFIHGIGIGLYPYTNFLNELNSRDSVESANPDEQVGIIAIEIMPVSFRVTHQALGRQEMCAEIDQILLKHFSPDQKFVLVSHSYGTVISTHLLKTPSIARRIGPMVLIDPVSILLHLPDVAYNFTRRKPRRANEHQLYYFASMDMGVSHTLSRHFFWNENVIWKEDLKGRNATVSLGGQDIIVDAEAVGRYLNDASKPIPNKYKDNAPSAADAEDQPAVEEPVSILGGNQDAEIGQDSLLGEEWKSRPWRGSGIEGLWSEHLDHAQIFDTRASRRRLIDVIKVYCNAE